MSTLAEQWIEEGIEQGMQQGSMKRLVRQAVKRFKVKPDMVYSILVGLRTEEIEELGERFLDAESLDQIREWGRRVGAAEVAPAMEIVCTES